MGGSKKAKTQRKKSSAGGVRRRGKDKELNSQLSAFGFHVNCMEPDGNCFFRAVADQIEGGPERHQEYRKQLLDYIEENEESFAPYIEDDEKFKDYVKRMRGDSAWAGHIELQALSRLYDYNVLVYQPGMGQWKIEASSHSRPTLQIHFNNDENHYDSIRRDNEESDDERLLPLTEIEKLCGTPSNQSSAPPRRSDTKSRKIAARELKKTAKKTKPQKSGKKDPSDDATGEDNMVALFGALSLHA